LHRLRALGVQVHARHRWIGWDDAARGALRFAIRGGEVERAAEAWVLALGGASWPQLGSDGAWVDLVAQKGVAIAALRASNCGFDIARRTSNAEPAGAVDAPDASDAPPSAAPIPGWSEHFRSRHAGHPVKTVALTVGAGASAVRRRGELVVTETGIEGNLVYAASHAISAAIAGYGDAVVRLDLLPDRSLDFVQAELARPRGSRSLSTHLKSRLGIDGVKAALLHELLPRAAFADLAGLARSIKALPLDIVAARPIAEAISSAGGVRLDAVTDGLMLRAVPGVYCAGEMLDWDAPTGGYLLTACLASGAAAARSVLKQIGRPSFSVGPAASGSAASA
ncbi:MAG: TIGR03862 family flavoprotein, partial [Caldimonas sp.]